MNMAIERVIKQINDNKCKDNIVPKSPKIKSIKEKTTETIKIIKKNNSTDNFMKFQWCWTL